MSTSATVGAGGAAAVLGATFTRPVPSTPHEALRTSGDVVSSLARTGAGATATLIVMAILLLLAGLLLVGAAKRHTAVSRPGPGPRTTPGRPRTPAPLRG